MFRNLIFDWSGTLVDDLGPVIEATNAVLGKYDIAPLDRETFRRSFRLPYREFYHEMLPDVPLDELECHFRPAFDAAVTPVTILPHSREKLEWCAAVGIRTFVLTSMDTDAFEQQLDGFGLRHLFEATYSSVTDKREVIHRILEEQSLMPEETAFVGDMTHDVETARHGGITSIAVLTGYNHPEVLAGVRPDLTVPDLAVLKCLLEKRRQTDRPVSTVGGLVHDDTGRVLMIRTHKWSDLWGIPGGKIERGESSEDALRREIREETALEIDRIRFITVQDCIDSTEFMIPAHFILLNYLTRAVGTDVRLNDEAEEFCWTDPAAALAMKLNTPTRFLLESVIQQGLLS